MISRRFWANSESGRFAEGTVEPSFCWWMISRDLQSAATTIQTCTGHPQITARYVVSAWCEAVTSILSLHTESVCGGGYFGEESSLMRLNEFSSIAWRVKHRQTSLGQPWWENLAQRGHEAIAGARGEFHGVGVGNFGCTALWCLY